MNDAERGPKPMALQDKRPPLRAKKMTPAHKAAYFGVLSALALALSFAESALAPLLALPLGVKPGLSNIAVMMAGSVLGLPAGLAVAAVKAVFAGITRGPTAMLLSGAGGLASALLVGMLLRRSRKLSEVGIGVLGGTVHNMVQLAVAALLMQTPGVFWTAPVLIISGMLAGAVTGAAVKLLRKQRPKVH